MKCPKCNTQMNTSYIRQSLPGSKGTKRTFKAIGIICPECFHFEPGKIEDA